MKEEPVITAEKTLHHYLEKVAKYLLPPFTKGLIEIVIASNRGSKQVAKSKIN